MAKKGKTPTLISGSSGKPETKQAKKKVSCKRCGGDIHKSENHFIIPDLNTPFNSKKPHCMACFKSILQKSQEDLHSLKVEAGLGQDD